MIQFSMYRSEPGNTLNELTHTHARMNRFSFCQRCNCGKEDIESSHDATRIVGGKEAELNRHPWQAECLLPLNKTFYWIDLRFPWPRGMGSTLVGRASYQSIFFLRNILIIIMIIIWENLRRHVLTAAHCLKDPKTGFDLTKDLSLLTVVLGLHKKGWVEQLVA